MRIVRTIFLKRHFGNRLAEPMKLEIGIVGTEIELSDLIKTIHVLCGETEATK